jgi:hypothetical protein
LARFFAGGRAFIRHAFLSQSVWVRRARKGRGRGFDRRRRLGIKRKWDALCIYTTQGFLNIDNNAAERAHIV